MLLNKQSNEPNIAFEEKNWSWINILKMKNIFCDRNPHIQLGIRLMTNLCMDYTWTLRIATKKELEVKCNYLYCRILKISWILRKIRTESNIHNEKSKLVRLHIKKSKILFGTTNKPTDLTSCRYRTLAVVFGILDHCVCSSK